MNTAPDPVHGAVRWFLDADLAALLREIGARPDALESSRDGLLPAHVVNPTHSRECSGSEIPRPSEFAFVVVVVVVVVSMVDDDNDNDNGYDNGYDNERARHI